KTGRQNEAGSKFDGLRCLEHDCPHGLHLWHPLPPACGKFSTDANALLTSRTKPTIAADSEHGQWISAIVRRSAGLQFGLNTTLLRKSNAWPNGGAPHHRKLGVSCSRINFARLPETQHRREKCLALLKPE